MAEMIQIKNNTYCFDCNARVGVYKVNERDVYFIDSSSDSDTAEKLYNTITDLGWRILGIINTHSHADHNGGNAFLQDKTGCKIFANGIEAAVSENTMLNTVSLIGGYPAKEFTTKLLYAQPSIVYAFDHPDFPHEFEIIDLPGHSANMVGIKTPDNVLFTADALVSEKALEVLHLTYIFDIEQHLKTLEYLKTLSADVFVPSHSKPIDNINGLCDKNICEIISIRDTLFSFLKSPLCFDSLLSKVIKYYKIRLTNEQYVLLGSTLRCYLGWMKNKGYINFEIKDNMLLWKKA